MRTRITTAAVFAACMATLIAQNQAPQQLAAFMKAELEKWRAVVKKSGAQLD